MKKIFLSPPHMSGKELEYIKDVFDSNYIAPVGEYINKFEEAIKNYTKVRNVLAVVNATSAIHLALRVLGVDEGDKVAVSTFTFIGGVSPILYQKAEPIFIDSDESWNMSPELLEEALKKEKIKAVIVAHLYGQVAKIEDIKYLCKKYGAFLIEDAAESLGATLNNKHSGTFGDFGVYSFNGNKLLTTSSGGVLISDNEEFIKKARFLSNQAKNDALWYEHSTYGYNYRMSNVLAAIGVAQMEVVEERIKRKREIFEIYKNELNHLGKFMPEIKNSRGNRWLTTLAFNNINPIELVKFLALKDIESRPVWKPMHMQMLFKNAKSYLNGVSESLFKKGICLPSGTDMNNEEVLKVSEYVKEFAKT